MRILLLDQYSDPGGAQQCLLDLLPGFRERGWRVVVGLPGNGKLFELVRAEGFDVERVNVRARAGGVVRLAREIRRLARRTGADLLYLNGPRLLPAAALARVPTQAVFHSHSYLKPVARAVARAALQSLVARVIASCEFVGRQWGPNVPVIYNGVRCSEIAHRGGRIGCIGRIAVEKGQLEFIDAVRLIHSEAPDSRFAIYGAALFSGVDYERRVRTAAKGLPIEFRGWVDDVYQALAELDLLLVPSTGPEATTRVILEAYAAGVPVIAFPSGGIPEVVDHGRTGFLAKSAAEMAQLAVNLMRGDRRPIIQAAHERWRRDFTLERYRQQVLDFLVK